MNSLRLKKALAGVSSGLILMGSILTAPIALAADFNDVPASHWGYMYVNDAVSKGFFDGQSAQNPSFYPDRTLNRAELAKLVVKAAISAGIIAGIDTTNAPTFTDVPNDAWYAPYVRTAAKANLLSGYKDGNGNPTGKYGPSDLVTRAQAAKSFVNAGGVPNKTSPSASGIFSDVIAGEWYVDYVSTAYNWSVMDGYKNSNGTMTGKFGPNDAVTRVQIAKIIYGAFNKVERVMNTNANGVVNGNMNNSNANYSVPKAGTLDVALSSNTPPATIIPQNTTAANYLTVKFTAGATNDISVNTLTVTRTGLGDRNDFVRVWGEMNGTRVTSRQSVGTDDKAVLVFNPVWVVKAGTTGEITVVAQMANGIGGGRYNALSVASTNDVGSSAQTVTGTFPLIGNTMQTASYTVTTVDFIALGSNSTYKVGETGREVAQFKLQNLSDSKAVVFKQVTLKNNGTAPWSDFTNLALYVGTTAVAPSANVTVNGDYITLNLGAGRTINYGQTETYSLRGDIVGVDNTGGDTVQVQVKYIEDLNAYEASTGFGVAPGANTWVGTTLSLYQINGGTLILSKAAENPSTSTVPPLTTDVTFIVGDAKVGQAFTADGIKVSIFFDDGDALTTTSAEEIDNLAAALDNVRVMWGDTVLGSTSLGATDLSLVGVYANNSLNEYIFTMDSAVTLSTTGKLKVVANVTNNAVEGYRIKMVVTAGTAANQMFYLQQPEYLSNGNQVQAADLVGSVTGNVITVGRASLVVSRVDGLTTKEVVEGVDNYQVTKFRLQAGETSLVKVTQLKFTNVGTTALSNKITTARLYDAANPATPLQEVNFTSDIADFNSINISIPANGSMDFLLKIDTVEGIAGSSFIGRITFIDAKDPNSNDAKVNNLYPAVYPLITSATFNFITSGLLTLQQDANRPLENVLVANSTSVPVGLFKLQAQKDAIDVTDLYFYNDTDASGPTAPESLNGRVSKFELTWPGNTTPVVGQILPAGALCAATGESVVRFAMAPRQLLVPQDGNVVVTVRADLNDITEANESGVALKLVTGAASTLNCVGETYRSGTEKGVRALSDATGTELAAGSLTVSGETNTFVVRDTRPTFAKAAPGNATNTLPGAATEMEIYRFTVAANSNEDVDLGQLSFDVTLSASVTATTFNLYELNNSQVLGTVGALVGGKAIIPLTQGAPDTGTVVPAGTTKTYILKASVADATLAGTGSITTKLSSGNDGTVVTNDYATVQGVATNLIVWSDESDPSHSLASTLDFTNSYLLNELNNIDSTTYSQTH